MKKTVYEWDVETMDANGDILDHDHDELPALLSRNELDERNVLVLVRDVFIDDSLEDRSWAYVQGGKLPEHFSGGNYGPSKVQAKYHAQLAKQLA